MLSQWLFIAEAVWLRQLKFSLHIVGSGARIGSDAREFSARATVCSKGAGLKQGAPCLEVQTDFAGLVSANKDTIAFKFLFF